MKKLQLILCVSLLSFMVSCSKSADPKPATSGDFGSWSYKGVTYKGTFSTWAGYIVESLADKPHTSGLQADFSSNSPAAGNYSVLAIGDVTTTNQVAISVVDSTLPSAVYISTPDNPGTVSVSRSGSSTTVKVTNVLLIGFTAEAKPDSIVVTGTIVK